MKKYLAIVLAGVMAFSLAGCGGSGSGSTATTAAPAATQAPAATTAAAAPAPAAAETKAAETTAPEAVSAAVGGDVTIGVSVDFTAIDPQKSNKVQDVIVYGNMFDTLVNLDDDLNIVPGLAESWERPDDKTTLFHLRKDVVFSNGEPMTAEDVAFTVQRVLDSPYVSYLLDFVDHAEVVDEYTVAVYSKEPFGPVLQHFTVPYSGIVPKKTVEEMGEDAFSLAPIGSGPYKLKEWRPGDYIVVERNDSYWGDKGSLDTAKFQIMPETSARLMSLESGEIDIAYDIAPNDVSKVENNSDLKAVLQPSMKCFFLPMNMKKEGSPLQDVNIRHAIDYAIDRQAICDAVASGYALPSGLVIPTGCVGYSPKFQAKERDLEKAKEYIAKSAYPDGCEFTILCRDDTERIETANIIQYQLSEVGITANVEIMESSAISTIVNNGEHDTIMDFWITDTCDAYYTLTGIYASWTSVGEGNDAFYGNEEVDKLIIEAGQELDDEERIKKYEKVYEAFEEDMPYIMTYYPYTCMAMRNNIDGFKINPNGAHQLKLITKN